MTSSVVRAFGLVATVLVAGVAAAQSTQAVEWKVSEGGNGHWYAISSAAGTWPSMRTWAAQRGAHLATVGTTAEWIWLKGNLPVIGSFVGGYQDHGSPMYSEPSGGWRWVTDEPFVMTAYMAMDDCPGGRVGSCGCGSPGAQDVLFFTGCCDSLLDDVGDGIVQNCDSVQRSGVIEWDSDCNNDGIVDYGQIRSGQLADDNANGIPDICETSVTGVIPPSVPSQGGSTIIINGRNFPAQPTVLVGGTAATNVVRVSDTRLTATAPAGLPGMRSITVNGFTLTDGIYYRPECGSDLDQDGEVTAADIAIVLLDFGPCYVTVTSPQADDSKPFMLHDQPAPAAPQSR